MAVWVTTDKVHATGRNLRDDANVAATVVDVLVQRTSADIPAPVMIERKIADQRP